KKDGLFNIPKITKGGVRAGVRELVLKALADCPDRLTLRSDSLATRVIFDDAAPTKAIGIEYLDGAHLYKADPNSSWFTRKLSVKKQVFATREIVLAGGAF